MNKEKNFISAVCYVYNNESNIQEFLDAVNQVLQKDFLKYEIICVNDCSNDTSKVKIKKWAEKNADVTINLINMSFHQGKELSINAGVDLAIGDFVYEFEDTFIDYNPKLIKEIYNTSLEGYDIVCATPSKTKKSSKIFYRIFNKFSNNQYLLNTITFKILSRRAINRINSINKTIPYRKAVIANCGLKLKKVLYDSSKRKKERKDNIIKKERINTASDALILFTDIGYKLALFISILMMVVTLGCAIYAIIIFLNSNPVAGWTTLMLLISFGFFILCSLLAMVLKYLSIIIKMIFNNNKYLIESIDKLN